MTQRQYNWIEIPARRVLEVTDRALRDLFLVVDPVTGEWCEWADYGSRNVGVEVSLLVRKDGNKVFRLSDIQPRWGDMTRSRYLEEV